MNQPLPRPWTIKVYAVVNVITWLTVFRTPFGKNWAATELAGGSHGGSPTC